MSLAYGHRVHSVNGSLRRPGPEIYTDFASDSVEKFMPTGNRSAFQRDNQPRVTGLAGNRLWRSTAKKLACGAFDIALMSAFGPGRALAAPIMSAIKVSSVRDELFWSVICGTVGMAVFLLLRAIVGLAHKVADNNSKTKKSGLPATSVEHFVEEARKLHIEPRIARETYQLLVSLIPAGASIGVNDELRGSLRLTEQQVESLILSLPELCDRLRQPANVSSVHSVYDLLHHVELSPKAKSGQFFIRDGVLVPVNMAVTVPVSPLSDLKSASPRDSRFRTRAHFSGVKRRASDYSGPFRRATDRKPTENYSGPYRRASDRQNSGSSSPDQRLVDRRSSERRAVTSPDSADSAKQHRAVPAPAPAVQS